MKESAGGLDSERLYDTGRHKYLETRMARGYVLRISAAFGRAKRMKDDVPYLMRGIIPVDTPAAPAADR